MNKKRRYFFTFIFTLIIFGFLWLYNNKNERIKELESELEQKDEKLNVIQNEYAACKGEIFHKSKLLEMEKAKYNRLQLKLDSL